MRTIFTLFAIAAFSLHIMLGCCWHHAHGAGEMPGHVHGAQAYDHVHVQALVPVKYHPPGGDHAHEEGDDEEHPAICTDPQCVYLHPGLVVFELDLHVALLPVPASDNLACLDGWPLPARWDDRGKFPPDVPLYLALAHFLN